jgi:integrase
MNSAGPAVVGHFGDQPRLVRGQFLYCHDVGNALASIRDADVWWAVKCCLMFMVFTCVRSDEARGATWDEVDLDEAEWMIPAIRMNNGVRHRVLLSTQAVEVLAYAREQGGGQGLIFPSRRGGKVIGPGVLSKLFLELEIPCVPNGFRTSFRNWTLQCTDIPHEVVETVGQSSNTVLGLFYTSRFFERRVLVMQEWADFLTETMGPVIRKLRD